MLSRRASVSATTLRSRWPTTVDPAHAVTFTAPIHDSLASLYVHIGRDADATGTGHQSTQAGVRFHAPTFRGRVQPYVAVGFEHLVTGAIDLSDILALKVQPGVRVYVRDSWGVGFRTPPFRISSTGNPYDRQTRVLISVFGEF